MRWPWVSRRAYEVVLDEYSRAREDRDRLMAQITTLTDQIVRIQRFSQGMMETPREPRVAEPMPADIQKQIMSVSDDRIRRMQTREAYKIYGQHRSWDAVRSRMAPGDRVGSDEDGPDEP